MKTVLKVAILVLVALTVGYNRGYYEGLKAERSAWESTAHPNSSVVRAGDRDNADGQIMLYSNPHRDFFFTAPFGRMPINVIDYRNLGGNTSRAILVSINSH